VIMSQKSSSMQIAEQLSDMSSRFKTPSHERGVCNSAIEELRRLHAENEALKLQITILRTPLTTDQKLRIALDCNMRVRTGSGAVKYATAIEAAHGIKP